jgi:hypothetical protein
VEWSRPINGNHADNANEGAEALGGPRRTLRDSRHWEIRKRLDKLLSSVARAERIISFIMIAKADVVADSNELIRNPAADLIVWDQAKRSLDWRI